MNASPTSLAVQPPRPPLLPSGKLLGHLFAFRDDPLRLFETARDTGDVVRLRVLNRELTVLSHPDAVHRVLVENAGNYTKQTRGYEALRRVLGNGLLTAEGEPWRRQRRIAQPAFQHRRLVGFAQTMLRAAEALVAEWEFAADRGAVVDVAAAMNRLTLRIAGETLFSLDISAETDTVGRALDAMLGGFLPTVTNPLLRYLPVPANLRFRRGKRALDTVVHAMIRARRADPVEHDDLLGLFMAARDEAGEGLSDEQLRDEALTLLLAGHETTANALAWTFHHLAANPAAAATLHAELDEVLGGGPVTLDHYPRLTWTEQVLKESMRLTPPAWVESRRATEADELGGYHIPAGSFVFVSQYALHRHPAWWVEPTRFDPARFGPGPHLTPAGTPRPRSVYLPFGDGQRKCIGEHFAMMETRLLLATLAQRFVLEPVSAGELRPEPSVTLRPRGGLPMRVHRRRPAPRAAGG